MYSHIAPRKDKPLAEADAGNNSQEDQADADSFAPTELRARYEREVPVKRIAVRLQKTARRLHSGARTVRLVLLREYCTPI